jgi:hypothetical protein
MSRPVLLLSLLLTAGSALAASGVGAGAVEVRGPRFELPPGCYATARTLDSSGDPAKIAASVTVTCGGPEALRLDLWPARPGVTPSAWFDERLGFTLTPASTRTEAQVTRAKRPALVVEHPASGQAHARRVVVFEWARQVLVVTLQRADEPERRALLDQVLDTLAAAGGKP